MWEGGGSFPHASVSLKYIQRPCLTECSATAECSQMQIQPILLMLLNCAARFTTLTGSSTEGFRSRHPWLAWECCISWAAVNVLVLDQYPTHMVIQISIYSRNILHVCLPWSSHGLKCSMDLPDLRGGNNTAPWKFFWAEVVQSICCLTIVICNTGGCEFKVSWWDEGGSESKSESDK